MHDTIITMPHADWPYFESLMRLALGLALGLLVGLERERSRKEAGLRTFGFIGLLGAIGGALGPVYGVTTLVLTGTLAAILNAATLRAGEGVELTTSTAMMVTAMAGILCGQGHTLSPAAVMVIVAALLTWKERLTDFSRTVSDREVRSALMLAILAIVIYPALPVGAIDPMGLVEPRFVWVTVILIASIGFFNYILWRMYGTRGAELSGFFGGLINSNFTVIELSERVRQVGDAFVPTAYRGILLATSAMVVRNAVLLLILAPAALLGALSAFVLMALTNIAMAVRSMRQRNQGDATTAPEIHMEMPFSLSLALKYGAIFLALHVVGALTQQHFGNAGFYFVSVFGGLLSSASAVAAAASLAAQGTVEPITAGIGSVLASFTSLMFSSSFVLRTRNRKLIRPIGVAMVAVAIAGVVGLSMSHVVQPWVEQVIQLKKAVKP